MDKKQYNVLEVTKQDIGRLLINKSIKLEMKREKIHIPVQKLIEFVKTNEVAWRKCDSLIEISHTDGYEFTEEEKVARIC